MKTKLSEDQIQLMIDRKEKAKFAFYIAIFIAVVLNAYYFYELYKLGGEKTLLLNSIEVFNALFSLCVYAIIVVYFRNEVTDVSYFLWYMESFISAKGSWDYGRKPIMFVKQWRMYSSFEELKKDVESLVYCYTRRSFWLKVSVIILLFVLLNNTIETLFCGETARIYMVWTDDVSFLLFFIPKLICALVWIVSLLCFLYYKEKVKNITDNSTKSQLIESDFSNL